jgi:pimeloyl-ACP methyl ester carboxylesterase
MREQWPDGRKPLFLCAGFVLTAIILSITACSTPALRIDLTASEFGMERRVVIGAGFRHIIYLRISSPESDRLHVYVEGDGKPWLQGSYIAKDPTSERPLALSLANLDKENVLYLGRPCYMGLFKDGLCEEKYWTSARYSPEVVASMVAALRNIIDDIGVSHVTLFGYSGGGSIAMLMAAYSLPMQIPSLDSVVTVAANLSVKAWVDEHGYLPLDQSLDPVQASYTDSIRFMHYIGIHDKNVAAGQLVNFVARHGGSFKVLDAVDHNCCWVQRWPALLQEQTRFLRSRAE